VLHCPPMSVRKPFLQRVAPLLRVRPLVVGTITGRLNLSSQLREAHSAQVDLLEVRLDTFPQVFRSKDVAGMSAQMIATIKRQSKMPLIATVRSPLETGKKIPPSMRLDDSERRRIFEAVIKSVELVDVEVRSGKLALDVSRLARRHHANVIYSFHDFRRVPDRRVLDQLLSAARRMKGDVFKVAVTPETDKELGSFLKWGLTIKNLPPVLIGMGRIGHISRFLGYSFGSILTYGHLGKEAAPGQIPARSMVRQIREIYGKN